MVCVAEKIMKFFRKRKSRVRSSESIRGKTYRDVAVQKNYQQDFNQDKVIQLLCDGSKKNSIKYEKIFSHYAPLPAIGKEQVPTSGKRPALARQKTYTVLNPVFVKGPHAARRWENNQSSSWTNRKDQTPVNEQKRDVDDIKSQNKYKFIKNKNSQKSSVNKNGGTAFWFAI